MIVITSLAVLTAATAWLYYENGVLLEAYRTAKRELADWHLILDLQSVPCPIEAFVLLAIGQSNAANHLSSKSPRNSSLPAYMYFRGRCALIEDPVAGASGRGGSLWPTLAQRLTHSLARPVVVIAGAVGGTSVQDWSSDRWLVRSRVLRSVKAAVADGIPPNMVVWIHGETDAGAGTMGSDYERDLRAVIEEVNGEIAGKGMPERRSASHPHWLITLTSKCAGESASGSDQIRRAQLAVAQRLPNVAIAIDTDELGDAYRNDGCHFNDDGRNQIVADLIRLISPKGVENE